MTFVTVCPHCQKRFTPTGWSQHNGRCAVRPEAIALTREIFSAICPDGSLPSMKTYDGYRKAHPAKGYIDQNHLVRHYGDWAKVGEAFGLKYTGPVKAMPSSEIIRAELRKWFNTTEPPYFAAAWDVYAKENHLPVIERIRRATGREWSDIVSEFEPIEVAPVRNYVDEKTDYRPYKKVTTTMKDVADWLTGHIQDEAQRAKEWFKILGIPQPDVQLHERR